MTTLTKQVPEEFGLIMNLMNAANWYKTHCETADCNVSVFQLRQAAAWIYRSYYLRTGTHHYEMQQLIENMPII